jgi:hypothetical protein
MKLKYFLSLCGALFFSVFIAAKNNLLINDRISFIFSDDYVFYLSLFFIFMGYYISTKENKERK